MPPTKIASLYAEIGVKDNFTKGAAGIKGELMSMAGSFLSTTALIYGFGKAVKFTIDQAAEAQKVDAQLDAVLRSTGGAAGMAKEELDDLATSLSHVSTYDDEAVKSAEALLLTFTSVGRDIFPDATQAILDMSTALGQDLQSSTIQLGKALNDPVAGITALKRVGVSFTEEQKKMIKTLVDTGDTLGAQKIILAELSKEFGGSAKAAADTYTGALARLKNEAGNLGEAIGVKLIPVLTDSAKMATADIQAITSLGGALNDAKNAAEVTLNPFKKVSIVFNEMGDWAAEIVGSNMPSFLTDLGIGVAGLAETSDGATKSLDEQAMATAALAEEMKLAEEATKAMSDANTTLYDLVGTLQDREEAYAEKVASLTNERLELEQEKQELINKGYTEESEEIIAINAKLEENSQKAIENANDHELANRKIILGLIERKLTADGILDDNELNWLLEKGVAWGIYSDTVIEEARDAIAEADMLVSTIERIPEETYTDINVNAAAALENVWAVAGAVNNIPEEKNIFVTLYENVIRTVEEITSGLTGHATGGTFEIPMSYGNEGFRMGNGDTASGGETVTITPKGQGTNNAELIAAIERTRLDERKLARSIVSAMAQVGA